MLKGKRINLRMVRDEDECRILLAAYNDLSQRADGDHTELKHPQGYMSEALPLFSAYLFATKPINRLRLQIVADNTGSWGVAEKSGYQQEGILRDAYFYRGKLCDFVIYGMLREECPKLSNLLEA